MLLNIVTPVKQVFSGEVTSVRLPGTSGSFQVLKNHAPLISSLTQGSIKIEDSKGSQFFYISGGVVEVLANKIIVLAESAEVDLKRQGEEFVQEKQRLEEKEEE